MKGEECLTDLNLNRLCGRSELKSVKKAKSRRKSEGYTYAGSSAEGLERHGVDTA